MRVRPFFWGLLVFVCIGILTLAVMVPRQVPAQFHIRLIQRPVPDAPTALLVKVTDAQGVTVDGAQIVSWAWMTNMNMVTRTVSTTPEGQGMYLVRINLSMVGPWMIAISMQADGFAPIHQMLSIHVASNLSLTSS